MSEQNYEMKPGLTYIDERNKQFRYSDDSGKLQWVQPLSRYKAFQEIKRGEAVSIVTKDELLDRAKKVNSIEQPIITEFQAVENTKAATSKSEKLSGFDEDYKTYIKQVFELNELTYYTYTTVLETYYHNEVVGGQVKTTVANEIVTVYTDNTLATKAKFPVISTETKIKSQTDIVNEEWNDSDRITITTTVTWNPETYSIIKTVDAYNQTLVDEIMADPDPYVIQTDSAIHERTVGLALEYAKGYGEEVHIQSYGKFTYDPVYEGKNVDFYGKDNPNHEEFDHTGMEYNPGFTYKDVGKKVFIAFKESDGYCGHLTVDSEAVSKFYHNIICLGYLTDAPQVSGESKTEIEISISGDQRGLLESTQFEARLGEDVAISRNDPIRVFAYGKEEDTKFKARLCLTPQAGTFKNTDFIAFQKMDGKTAVIYFNGDDFNINGVIDDDDKTFLHMAKCYADIQGETIGTIKAVGFNDTQTVEGVKKNIEVLSSINDASGSPLTNAFNYISDLGLKCSSYADPTHAFGYIDLEATDFGGYYAMYISNGLKDKFDGSVTECHGSYENKGLAVLADIRVPERRDILGVYYGTLWDTILEKGYTTIFMRLGEFDVPEESKQFDGNFVPGQEYYLGTNGRICKYPYNQFDFVSKIGTIKYSNDNDLKFVVDVGESTRHYNGDLPVGYMKPSIRADNAYLPEYGFVLMDGITKHPKAKPYDALYERLLGWFSPNDIEVSGEDDMFRVPEVSRTMPTEVIEKDADGNDVSVLKHIKVPMQIKFLASGIYEEMARIPFKRFFGTFASDTHKEGDDWTPVKCQIVDCDITDIVDYGISEDGYTKPGLDNLDVHLFIDPNENYVSGAHDWHEVHEGFFNWNNSTTFGYTWKIIEEPASIEHPYGCYKLSMDVGKSEGVAYVTADNQAPKKLNGCHYKLYVARREVFSRQFDIEDIYKNYLTNSVYTDEAKSQVVLTKAVTGKAVIDAIENRYHVNTFIGNEDATIKLGDLTKPVGSLILNTKGKLPIIAAQGVVIQNEEDNMEADEANRAAKVVVNNGKITKEGKFTEENILAATDVGLGSATYKVAGNEIPTVNQVRAHATATIDNDNYISSPKKYPSKDNKHGAIHGMIFGEGGNIDASTLWGIKPSISHNDNIASHTIEGNNIYIPVVYKSNTGFESNVEGNIHYRNSKDDDDVLVENVNSGTLYNFKFETNGDKTNINGEPDEESVIRNTNLKAGLKKYYHCVNLSENGVTNKAVTAIDPVDGSIKFVSMTGTQIKGGLSLYAGNITSTSRSEYKRVYGELIRDPNLVSDADLVGDSKRYDENKEYTVIPEGEYDVVYKYIEDTNKFHSILGSALQAAYEMPLAYWQYNTEKEWYKDRLGVIVQRIESVAENIEGKKLASVTIGSLIATAKTYTDKDLEVVITRTDKESGKCTVTVNVDGKEEVSYTDVLTVGDVVNAKNKSEYVVFTGVLDAVIDLANDDFKSGNPATFKLEGGSTTGTQRKLFDNLTSMSEEKVNTTPDVAASLTVGDLVVTAKEAGVEGNKISVGVVYTQDAEHYIVTVKNADSVYQYEGKNVSELHDLRGEGESDENLTLTECDFATLTIRENPTKPEGQLVETENKKPMFLNGGAKGTAVSRELVNTNYKENEYQYTQKEADSIKEYLTTIIDNSSNGQDVLSSIGLLFNAAKETQERLLRVEASTFGRDYETIPGDHEPYVLSNMPGVVPDPTNYGLNRLIRAICQEIYYDSNPFDDALANGDSSNVSSFSRIDRLDREIHGELNTEDGVQTAPNVLDSVVSTTYPYEDMIRAEDDTKVREAEFTIDGQKELAEARGTNVKTRVDMTLFNKDNDGNYTSEIETNTHNDEGHFNGIVDAIYRITTKLNALTESINNGDNIANSPIRLNTIRQNIEHIIREAYFDDTYNIEASDPEQGTSSSGYDKETFNKLERVEPTPYHDVNGENHKAYDGSVSRFDKITQDLYNYVIDVNGESVSTFGDFYEFGDEKVTKLDRVFNEETGEITVKPTEKQVYYTGRKFNGKHLLVDNKVAAAATDLDGTDVPYSAEVHVPQNLNDYNYASLIDIIIDALGPEWFRKEVSRKIDKDDSYNNIDELRHNRTMSERLDNIESCLDKVVRKLSRKHSFEEETDITNNNENQSAGTDRTDGGRPSTQTVFSIERYLQFLNEYLGYEQTTSNDVDYKKGDKTTHHSPVYQEHWANGIDESIWYEDENGEKINHNLGLDGDPNTEGFEDKFGSSIGKTQYSAEWAFKNKKNIHAGLINTLARLQNEEARSQRIDAILGDDFKSTQNSITTTFDALGDGTGAVQTENSTSAYTLTDDIADVLKTLYGKDNHNSIEENDKGSFTDFTHRSLVEATNTNTRFVAGEKGNNIIDIMINEMYKLPRPIRAYNEILDGTTTTEIDKYFNSYKATKVENFAENADIFIPTDNSVSAHDSANNKNLRDSRLATYYDFEEGNNYYDVPDSEYALSWNNRDEFFNDTGRLEDAEIKEDSQLHHRWSRFEVLENEIRNLRKLIGLDFGKWNGQSDLIDLKFNGVLKFFGDRVNNGFNGNPFGEDVVRSYTDQFNWGDKEGGSQPTNILKFLLNSDKSERLLRTELGFSESAWAKVKFGNDEKHNSGYDFWYDYTYSTKDKKDKELLTPLGIHEGDTNYNEYGLFGQQNDETYENRHSVYDRLLALEQNAVRVDAWLDSVKNNYRPNVGKTTGKSNIYAIVDYLGNFTWDEGEKTNHYYGSFGEFDKINLKIDDADSDTKYTTVTDELNGHHSALINLYNVIGRDDCSDEEKKKYLGDAGETIVRSLETKNTIWARLNAVERLNQNDIDIINIIHSSIMVDNDDGVKVEDVIRMSIDTNIPSDSITTRMLTVDDVIGTTVESLKTVTSKGYVDNAINYAINKYHLYVGDRISSVTRINDSTETPVLYDETVETANVIALETETNNVTDYYNAATIIGLKDAINKVNEQTQHDVNTLYNNLNNLMAALQYAYNDPASTLTGTTKGSLLAWGSTTTPEVSTEDEEEQPTVEDTVTTDEQNGSENEPSEDVTTEGENLENN